MTDIVPDWENWATDGKPYGTLRWFGETWGAPVNDPVNHVETPVGMECAHGCDEPIVAGDRGVTLPYTDGKSATTIAYHLWCWFKVVGVPHE